MRMVNKISVPRHKYSQRERSVINILKKTHKLNIKTFLNVGYHGWDEIGRASCRERVYI